MGFTEEYGRLKKITEDGLAALLPENIPDKLRKSMAYSLTDGGKRLRPVMYLAVCEAYGRPLTGRDIAVACAIECVHTYSLIHDDLPSMDNDDMRRGRPTNHKVFGPAMATLAGDGLLNLAYELLSAVVCMDPGYAPVMREISACAGALGMVGGQALEFDTDLSKADVRRLTDITILKTAKLFECAVVGGALACERENSLPAWRAFAVAFGRAFQLRDDLLDIESGEHSLAALLGKERAEQELEKLTAEAEKALSMTDCEGGFLSELTAAVLRRNTDGL